MTLGGLERCRAGYRHPFIFGLLFSGGVGDLPRTLTDLAMSQLSAELRRRPGWWLPYMTNSSPQGVEQTKEALPTIVPKEQTRTLTVTSSSNVPIEVTLTSQQIQYVYDELQGYALLRDEYNDAQVSCFERIWESDGLLNSDLSSELMGQLLDMKSRQAVAYRHSAAYSAPEIFFIDMLLHPLVYNRTLVSGSSGDTPKSIPAQTSDDAYYTACPIAALLPSDVHVAADGSAKFLSYINNLHWEDNMPLYTALEGLLTKTIPLFEHTLTDLHRNNPISPRIKGCPRYTEWDDPDPPEDSDDEEGWSDYERTMRNWVLTRPIELPDVSRTGYTTGSLEFRRERVNLRSRKLQVVTRVMGITLTDGLDSEPQGFDWHVEGMRNERIVACALHIIKCDNIVPSAIEFRMAVTQPVGFLAGDEGATLRTWGLKDGDPCHQRIGSAPLRQGLSITWPNLYQHRILPLKRADNTKEGDIIFVSFLLVDPDVRPILSTANVAPQKSEWIERVVYSALEQRLPPELIDMVWSHCDWFASYREAEQNRSDYLDALTHFTAQSNQLFFCLPFDAWSGARP